MNRLPPGQQDGTGIWYTLWTASKLIMVLLICVPVAIFMLTSSQPTATPTAPPTETPTGPPPSPTAGATPTAIPAQHKSVDTFVPGTLIYVQGHTLVKLRHDGDPVRIASNATQPAISPNGRRIAYVQVQKNYQDLYLLDLRSGKSTQLTQNAPSDPTDPRTGLSAGAPAWSDDGTSVFFVWNYPGTRTGGNWTDFSVYRCPVTALCTQATAQVIDNAGYVLTGGDYEPTPRLADPSTLVYSKYATNTTYNPPISLPALIAHNLTTGADTTLTSRNDAVSQPVWNPTGRYLAFVKTALDEQSNAIYVMPFHPPGDPADYDHAQLLVKGAPLVSYPVFSPDGRYLAYLANDQNDQGFHLYIARVHLGRHPYIEKPQLVRRAGTVDSDRLAWTR